MESQPWSGARALQEAPILHDRLRSGPSVISATIVRVEELSLSPDHHSAPEEDPQSGSQAVRGRE